MSGISRTGGGRPHHRRTVRAVLVAAAFLGSALGGAALGVEPATAAVDQFVFFDAALAHGAPAYAQPVSSSPSNWVTPTDYASGKMYLRIDVTERPSAKPVDVQVCVWRNGFDEETCSRRSRLPASGVSWVSLGSPSSWWKLNGNWEWTTPFTTTRLMFKDAATGKLLLSKSCGAACYTGDDLESHIPIRFEASAIVVARGAKLLAPTEWIGCPLTWSASCAGPVNVAPSVSAGPDVSTVLDDALTLRGSVTDDGLPVNRSLTTKWSKSSGPGLVTFGDPTSTTTTAGFAVPGRYVLRLTAKDGAKTASDTVVVTVDVDIPPETANAAALIVSRYPLSSADALLRDRLTALGYEARAFDDNKVSADVLQAFDVVVVAPSVSPSALPTALADLDVPLLNMKAQASPRLGVGKNAGNQTGQTSVDVVEPLHPIVSGLSGRVAIATKTSFARSVPAPGATVVATIANRPSNAMIYTLDAGAALISGAPSPERRAVFQLGSTAAKRLNETGWSLFDRSIGWLDELEEVPDPDVWAIPGLSARIPITVDPLGITREDATVGVAFSGDVDGVFDPSTIRVVEVDDVGAVIDGSVVAQFDPDPGFDGDTVRSGTLLVHLAGSTDTQRYFRAYYGSVGEIAPPSPSPLVVTTGDVVDQGLSSLLVDTPSGAWYYQPEGGGFSSLDDADGFDWIGWNSAVGSAGTYRGIPNLVHPGGLLHPGATDAVTTVMSSGPLRTRFETVTGDGGFRVQWDLYADHAQLTVLEAAHDYWMLYEGTPGGQVDPSTDKVIRANGVTTNLSEAWTGDVAGEWVAFADTVRHRSLFMAQLDDDAVVDSYRLMENNMTVFGFGRSGNTPYLSGPTQFVMGLVDATTHAEIANTVVAMRQPAVATTGPPATRPG